MRVLLNGRWEPCFKVGIKWKSEVKAGVRMTLHETGFITLTLLLARKIIFVIRGYPADIGYFIGMDAKL